jgi:hypothetical protein
MARPRKLPEDRELRKLLRSGLTYAEIGERFGVTAQAVSDLANRGGLNIAPRRVSLKEYIPWRVPTEHHDNYLRRMLGLYGRQRTGGVLSAKQAGQLKLFMETMDAAFDGKGGVVQYDPEHPEGPFIVVPRRPRVDKHYVRKPDPAPKAKR